jgi:hypothetical protein
MNPLQARLNQARRETQEYAQRRGAYGRIGRTGRRVMDIHPLALANAMRVEGRDVIYDKGYWDDMRKRHPELAVEQSSNTYCGSSGVTSGSSGVKKVTDPPARNTTFRQVRRDDGIVEEWDYKTRTLTLKKKIPFAAIESGTDFRGSLE